MLAFPCLFDPLQHELMSGELLDWVKREVAPADKDRYFLYRHKIHRTFVIARWATGKYGVFTDFLNLGLSLATFGREEAMELRSRLFAPLSADGIAKTIRQVERDHNSEMGERNEYMKDMKRRYKSAGATI